MLSTETRLQREDQLQSLQDTILQPSNAKRELPGDPQFPIGLPSQLTGPLVRLGPENPEIYQVSLDASDVQAIEEAIASFKALEIDGQEISKDNFQMPRSVCDKLLKGALEVHQGSGVCMINGLEPTRYSDADNLLLFLGLANYIGDKHGIQDRKGNVISHITDAKNWTVPYEKRHGVHTNQPLTWHCDMGADILALQVRHVAAKGGATMVASSWKVYNDLVAERPDVVRVLAEPDWPVHVSDRKSRFALAPLIAFHDSKLMVNFDPSRLGTPPAMEYRRPSHAVAIPALTEAQREALAVVSTVAEKHSTELKAAPGDLIFINNWAILHARHAYLDATADTGGATEPRRHLLRLWLRNSNLGWKIPDSLRAPWEAAFGYTDEGYVSGEHNQVVSQLKYAVMPQTEYKTSRYTTGSAAFVIDDSESEDDEN